MKSQSSRIVSGESPIVMAQIPSETTHTPRSIAFMKNQKAKLVLVLSSSFYGNIFTNIVRVCLRKTTKHFLPQRGVLKELSIIMKEND